MFRVLFPRVRKLFRLSGTGRTALRTHPMFTVESIPSTREQPMEDVTDILITELKDSKFVQPVTINYKQNAQDKRWDAIKVGDGVLILIYNKSRDVLVFVKQFRPAVYANNVVPIMASINGLTVDPTLHPAVQGMSLELCAGLVDKDKSLAEIAQDEMLEECGYKVPLENIEKIATYRDDPDLAGARHTVLYAEVTDSMRLGPGGGNPLEGEFIEIVEYPVDKAYDKIMDDSVQTPFSTAFAVLWFYRSKGL